MKKITAFILCAVICLWLAGCGTSDSVSNKASGKSQGVSDLLAQAAETQPATAMDNITFPNPAESIEYPALDYDAEIDLTSLNSNMVYSEVSSMMISPENYIGKTVKANGTFDVYTDIGTGNFYYACIIQDATACCANGLEFIWDGDHVFPNDYPEVNTPITIGGVFETYEEDGATYCRLKDAQLSFEA